MENSAFKSKIEFEKYLEDNFNYHTVSKMNFDDYRIFVIELFSRLYELKKNGLEKEHIYDFVNKYYSNVMENADDSDIMFERRFSAVIEELSEFCSSPFFWDSDLDVYFKKWDKLFQIDWFKNINLG
ncbi:hypothetical protein [Flavobacterium cerinum]|uniref:Uncharacterized protein n=1 Tax=Flavobacterium cerinum TaxID=2502784 RepID=A0ABY5IWF7_9FLAO|nr:hypothetical protein [Flavobacterium cerinum]UUC46721.1 hypothetical protein NOX80_05855 [Flavobacterium cerinum]